jgi:hypothetical protein
MPKWQVSLTRDASQDAEVVVEAGTAEEAKRIFLHDMDRDAIEWTEGDWLGDTEVVEVLRAHDDAEPTALDPGRQQPRLDDGDIRKVRPLRGPIRLSIGEGETNSEGAAE